MRILPEKRGGSPEAGIGWFDGPTANGYRRIEYFVAVTRPSGRSNQRAVPASAGT
ncbi:MAG: hypothetical protein IE921_03835 [Rhodobacteraceae bacterium]|nr:hypothetical protein [Paracoccaceae bacterium]